MQNSERNLNANNNKKILRILLFVHRIYYSYKKENDEMNNTNNKIFKS